MTEKAESKSSGINQEVGTPASLINSKNHGREVRVLPADYYDTLEFSALVYRGIGRESAYVYVCGEPDEPLCIAGHATFAADSDGIWRGEIGNYLLSSGVSAGVNDTAVLNINLRRRRDLFARVSWKEYCAELNIVRGD